MASYKFWNFFRDISPPTPELTEKDYADQSGKTFLVTGTSAGVGKEVAKILLSKNAIVVAVNRNKEKTLKATEEIFDGAIELNPKLSKEQLSKRLTNVSADLSDLTTIKPAAMEIAQVTPQLDTIIFNAGVMMPPHGSLTKQGYELQFGANVMAHQLLLDLIEPLLVKSAEAGNTPRAIFTTSYSHAFSPPNGGLNWDFRSSPVDGQELYGQSKVGNIYTSAMFGEKHKNMIALAVHPGFLVTELQRNMSSMPRWIMQKLLMHPARYGAYSELWAALSPKITVEDSGKYVVPWGRFLNMRSDIQEGRYDGTAKKMVDWVEKEIAPYK